SDACESALSLGAASPARGVLEPLGFGPVEVDVVDPRADGAAEVGATTVGLVAPWAAALRVSACGTTPSGRASTGDAGFEGARSATAPPLDAVGVWDGTAGSFATFPPTPLGASGTRLRSVPSAPTTSGGRTGTSRDTPAMSASPVTTSSHVPAVTLRASSRESRK